MTEDALRLLVIDDDDVDRMAVLRALRQSGLSSEISEAIDFESASQAILARTFDCVISDFHLPGGDGLQILDLARKADNGVPFVFLTGQGDEALAVDLMKRGAADYLSKQQLTPERLAVSLQHATRLFAADRRAKDATAALARQAEQLARLAGATVRIHGTLSLDETMAAVTFEARTLIGAHVATTRLITESGELESSLTMSVSDKYSEWHRRRSEPPPSGVESLALRSDAITRMSHTELEATAAWQELRARPPPDRVPLRGLLAAPLVHRDGRRLGVIQVSDRNEGDFNAGDEAILVHLAQSASVAIENARLYREANQATRARDEMVAIVSHDLRNPLNTIALTTSLLRGMLREAAAQNSQITATLDRSQRSVVRMKRLIEDLLETSQIEAGRLAVAPQPERAESLVVDAIESVASIAHEKGCTLIPGTVEESLTVLADRHRILQVFGNLLGNAIKFTPSGGTITVSATRAAGCAVFEVSDTGAGIESASLPHLFDRFWKAVEASREGAGLGLYIARGIVEAHDGSIAAESAIGKGTRISFRLPLAE